jgi:WhiB family transcriptional regulator, redox-sensing transcriptional regulator
VKDLVRAALLYIGTFTAGGRLMATPIIDGVSLWQEEAACRGSNNDTFFSDEKAAKGICAGCPVMVECLEAALVYNYSGVWGGTTDKERQRIPHVDILREDYKESGLYNKSLKA